MRYARKSALSLSLSLSLFSVTAPFERKMEMARDQKKQEEDKTDSVRFGER
jgi:hypothetical protein